MSENLDEAPTAVYEGNPRFQLKAQPCGKLDCVTAVSQARREGLRTGLQRAGKMAKSLRNSKVGWEALANYLKAELKKSEIPF